MSGTSEMRNRMLVTKMTIGMMDLEISKKFTLPMRLVTKSSVPTGGVSDPMQMLTVMMTPKCIGSIPIF